MQWRAVPLHRRLVQWLPGKQRAVAMPGHMQGRRLLDVDQLQLQQILRSGMRD
jgi:hypothetical protein